MSETAGDLDNLGEADAVNGQEAEVASSSPLDILRQQTKDRLAPIWSILNRDFNLQIADEEIFNSPELYDQNSRIDYIRKATVVIDRATELLKQYELDLEQLEKQQHTKFNVEWWNARNELDRYVVKTGLQRALSIFRRNRAQGNFDVINQEVERLDLQIHQKKDQLTKLKNRLAALQRNRADYLEIEIKVAVNEIASNYFRLIESTLSTDDLVIAFQEQYVEENIKPWLSRWRVPVEIQTELLDMIRYLVQHAHLNGGDPNTYFQELMIYASQYFPDEQSFFYELINPLKFANTFYSVLCELVTRAAATDLRPIIDSSRKMVFSDQTFEGRFGASISTTADTTTDDLRGVRSTFYKQLGQKMRVSYEYMPIPQNDLAQWAILTRTDLAQSLFGQEMIRQDDEQYKYLLQNSLSDGAGHFIESLRYYPTPESIRNLVLLAAAERRGYRTVNANKTLYKMATKQPHWHDQVDQFVAAYPAFASKAQLLYGWNYRGDNRSDAAHDLCAEYARSNVESQDVVDLKILELSYDAIPNAQAIDVLVGRGTILERDGLRFKEAERILVEVEEKTIKERSDGHQAPFVQVTYYKTMLHQLLVRMLKNNSAEMDGELDVLRNNYLRYAEEIINSAHDTERLSYLSASILSKYSAFILSDGATIRHFIELQQTSIYDVDLETDVAVGQHAALAVKAQTLPFSQYVKDLSYDELGRYNVILSSGDESLIESLSDIQLIVAYIRSHSEDYTIRELSAEARNELAQRVEGSRIADDVYVQINQMWRTYLEGEIESLPFSLLYFCQFVEICDGAGPLTQLQTLTKVILTHFRAMSLDIPEEAKRSTTTGLATVERQFQAGRWSNDARTEFYSISQEIQSIDPILFAKFFEIFNRLDSESFKVFIQSVFPLFRTWLVMLEQNDAASSTTRPKYDYLAMLQIYEEVDVCVNEINTETFDVSEKRTDVLHYIKAMFKKRFGILTVPDSFSAEEARSMTNVAVYLTNLNERNPQREAVLSYYLALMLNHRWQDFRAGVTIPPEDLLSAEIVAQLGTYKDHLAERSQTINAEFLGIDGEAVPEFLVALQTEASAISIGNVETIDVKLANIVLSIKELADLDIYTDSLDKARMRLLQIWGKKRLGSTVARLFQSLPPTSRDPRFSEEDQVIVAQITEALVNNGVEVNQSTVKNYFQDGMKSFTSVWSIVQLIEEYGVERELEKLEMVLKPPILVIEAYRRMGEQFAPKSGAIPHLPDLQFLENLVVKNEDKLSHEELSVITDYIDTVRQQVTQLDEIFFQMKNKLSGAIIKENDQVNPFVIGKLQEILAILDSTSESQSIASTVTNNLNLVIENMRACLSATKAGSNNDTNLTFGDPTKFYVYSQVELTNKGSIADEISFFVPIEYENDISGHRTEYAFVLDQIYGAHTPTVLQGHIQVVLKKIQFLKERFHSAKISIFVPSNTMISSGSSSKSFESFLTENGLDAWQGSVQVDIPASPAGDHYIEFGGESARSPGKRSADGYVIMV